MLRIYGQRVKQERKGMFSMDLCFNMNSTLSFAKREALVFFMGTLQQTDIKR